MIKRITGKDMMKTRTLHEKPSQWKAQFKLIIASNNKPKIIDPSEAMWSRVKCIPFSEKIPPEEQDKMLGDKLKNETSGILNWMLAGCRNWLENGMKEPALVSQTVENYKESADKLAEWFDYSFEKRFDGFVPFKIYYPLYKLWCINHQTRPVSENTLPPLLEARGYEIGRGWYENSKKERVRERGCFGFQLKTWLSGIDGKTVTEIKGGKLVDRLSGQTIISPIQLILEAMDSDINLACGQYGQVDRLNQVESILLVSCEERRSSVSSLSTMSIDSDIPIFLFDSESVQSVQSVQNNNNIQILIKDKIKDKYDLLNKPDSIKDLERLKINMRNEIIVWLNERFPDNQEIPGDEFIDRIITDYCSVRGWC